MSSFEVLAQAKAELNSGKIFKNEKNIELKQKIYQLKYSDPNLAISICLNSLEDYIPLGPSLFTLYLYSTLGELYLKKDLPVLALSYLEEAQRISAALNSVRGVANCEFLLAKHTDSPEKTLELVKSAEHKYESLGDTIHLKRVRDFMQSIKNQS